MRPAGWIALALLVSPALPMLAVAQEATEWPMYRADAAHTGFSGSDVPATLEEPLVVDLSGSALTSPVAVGGRIFVCSADGTLFSVWADDGSVAWSRPLGGNCTAEPAVNGTAVYALAETGRLQAIDAANGKPLWNYSFQAGLGFTLPLTFFNDSLLVSTTSGAVFRLSASAPHQVMWQTFLGGNLKGPVTAGDGQVYVLMAGGNATALDLETSGRNWSLGPGTGSSNEFQSAYFQGRLYIGTRGQDVFCLDTSKGSTLWSRPLRSTVSDAPAIGSGMIVVSTQNGLVHALGLATGDDIWENPFDAGGDAVVSPAIAGGTVVLCDEKGRLNLLDSATGLSFSSLSLPGRRFSSPAVFGGRILVSTAEGALCIIGPAATRPAAALELSPARLSTGEEAGFFVRNYSSPTGLAAGGLRIDFGDGNESGWVSGTQLRHSYGEKGTYWVTLTVRDANGTESHPVSATVEVFNDRPLVALRLPAEVRAGLPAAFWADARDPDGHVISYEWDFEGDGTYDWNGSVIPAGFNHTYALNGTFDVTVRVRDDNGSLAASSVTLKVLPAIARPPVAPPVALVSLPVAVASVSFVSLAAVGAGLSLTEFGKYRLFTLFIVPLYVRLKKDEVLDNYTRGRIHGYITANPGDNYNSIRDALELTNGIVAHHLHTLEREGLVQSMRDGMYRRFWPANARLPPEDEGHFNIQKRIVAVIRDNPGISQKEIAQRVGVSSPTVNYHIRVLETAGMIHVSKLGRRTGCYVVEDRPHT